MGVSYENCAKCDATVRVRFVENGEVFNHEQEGVQLEDGTLLCNECAPAEPMAAQE